ncbi:MAG: PH domain-containing protein [Candidatus Margulisiibacteriota bacterium]
MENIKSVINLEDQPDEILWSGKAFWVYYFIDYVKYAAGLIVLLIIGIFLNSNFPVIFDFINVFYFVLIPVPIYFALYKYILAEFESYQLTASDLISYTGILNRKADHLNISRVRDVRIEQPFYLEWFNRANVLVISPTDVTHGVLIIKGVKDYKKLEGALSKVVGRILDQSHTIING